MKKGLVQRLLPHLIAVGIFLVVAVIYCKPVLQGQVLKQEDITQWRAMSKSLFDYKAQHGHFPLWTNSMFSGMPAYQIAMEVDNPVSPGIFYTLFSLGLPKPISFFFLACLCFYFLSQVLRVNPYIGIIGALAYAYATYNPVLVATGHDTKMQSIAFMPALIGSLILLYERKYLWGAALTALFTVLLISMNHMQIVYYALIIAGIMTLGYLVHWIRNKEFRHMGIALGLAAAAAVIGVLSNAVTIFTTLDVSKTTIRGGTELPGKNETTTGLSKDYAFSYSMYKTEPLVMMVPRIYGASDKLEKKEEDSKAVEELRNLMGAAQQVPAAQGQQLQQLAQALQRSVGAYWGGIGGTSGPPYVGAIICFLALVGFFILDTRHKWWILATCILSILMSWGGYFEGFNSVLLKLLPGYNKFRAPSVIIVIPTFLFCMMAVMTLQKIISDNNRTEIWNRYKKGLLLTAGIFAIVLAIYFTADFLSENDRELLKQTGNDPDGYARRFFNALVDDRKELFMGSFVRSLLFVAAAAAMVWMAIRKNAKAWMVLSVIGVLAFIDVMGVDTNYLNDENYQDKQEYENAFVASPADNQVLADKNYFRVFDLRQGLGTLTYGASTAYFHKSIGGYHPAKLSIYQDLIEHQLSKTNFQQLYFSTASNPVLNMLNTKYILFADGSGRFDSAFLNPGALGPAWFVNNVRFEKDAQSVMNALGTFSPKDTAIVFERDKQLVSYAPAADSAATIQLVKNDNDEVTYTSTAATNRFAVFSEVFYNLGWKAYIDDKETPIVRTNYVLRGLSVPAGNHRIRFVFHPSSFYSGKTISLMAGILVILLILAAAVKEYMDVKKRPLETTPEKTKR
jgi:hypothetical protein